MMKIYRTWTSPKHDTLRLLARFLSVSVVVVLPVTMVYVGQVDMEPFNLILSTGVQH